MHALSSMYDTEVCHSSVAMTVLCPDENQKATGITEMTAAPALAEYI